MISVLIADDHGIVREGIRSIVEGEGDIRVCSEAADGREVLEQIDEHAPDVVMLDISMPNLGGLESLARIRASHPDLKVILLSIHADAPLVRSALSLGADGYVLKNARTGELPEAIRSVVRGGSYFSPQVAREIVSQVREPDAAEGPFSRLTRREREVLHGIADGLSTKEVAARLDVTAKTVEAHRTSLMRKLGARKATELVRYAVRHGLIEA